MIFLGVSLLSAAVLSPAPGAASEQCNMCPDMVQIPAGTFLFGSPDDEDGHQEDEAPQSTASVSSFELSRFEVTVGEYRQFVEATDYEPQFGCLVMQESGSWGYSPEASWRAPGFDQTSDHPVTCISWNDANAYVDWLNSQHSGPAFRLPSEVEWEYAARANSQTRHWWGDTEEKFCEFTNGADASARRVYSGWQLTGSCDDGFVYTAPVGNFDRPNAFGVEDMVGNVWEWVADCYSPTHADNPLEGSPVTREGCDKRVMRGGAWGDYGSFYLRTAYRGAWDGSQAFSNLGFRIARDLSE